MLWLAASTPSIAQAIERAVDPCRAAAREGAGGIVVCGRTQEDKARRFRLPPAEDRGWDPSGTVDSVSRERHRLLDGVQDATRGSCGASGASGSTGCMIKSWRERDQQKGW